MINKILVISESVAPGRTIAFAFEQFGYEVTVCEEASLVPNLLHELQPDAVILAADGLNSPALQWCQFTRAFTATPIIVANAQSDEMQEINCLTGGAVDYVLHSRGMRVLLTRTDQHLKRLRASQNNSFPVIHGDFQIHADTRVATFRGKSLNLTRTEFDVMNVLMTNAHRVVHRRELIDRVWGSWYGDPHVLETHLSRLRNKVRAAGGPRIASPVRGVGYRLTLSEMHSR